MSRVIINTGKVRNIIPPEIYGQFAEHLGHGIYGGIYVGQESEIPNVRGIRQDVVSALKHIQVPVIRWPGGCFADEYHWKDGIGPQEKRPTMVNSNWGGVVEDNSFGTHEFLDLCEQVGAAPYINGNVGSGEVREMQEWIEYITCGDQNSTLAQNRSANGHQEPWKLKWFGVGNENWGCGGNMCPSYYAQLYKRYQTFVRNYGENKIAKIACGPNVDDYHWMETVMREANHLMDYITLHYYTFDGNWENKGKSLNDSETGWHQVMSNGYRMEKLIQGHLAIMDRIDPSLRVKLIVDEWGTWHQTEEGTNPGFLYQQNTIRDALLASLTLDIFNRHSDRIAMANIAQMINVLQAMILTDDDRMLLTPTYHVFDLYKEHMGANLLDSWISAEDTKTSILDHEGRSQTIHYPRTSLTASEKNGQITVTANNFSPTEDLALDIQLYREDCIEERKFSKALVLHDPENRLNAHNTFDQPSRLRPEVWNHWSDEGQFTKIQLPPACLVQITFV